MLKIERVKMENFCNIPLADFEFPDGLTVVIGPNGSGKTSFLNAIYSAFTGGFDRGPGDAAGCIRQNQDGKTYTEVYGTILDRPFRIRRDIRFQSDGKTAVIGHGLWLDGNRKKESESKNEIAAWIESTTGLTREMMQEYLFIGQYDFVDYFSRRNSERWKKFSALCGTKSFEKRYEDFSKLLNVDRSSYEKTTVSVVFLQESIKEAEETLERIRLELDRVRTEAGDSASLAQLCAEQEKARTKLQTLERLKTTLEHLGREKGTVQTSLVRSEASYRESLDRIREAERNKKHFGEEIEQARVALEEMLFGTTYEAEVARLESCLKSNTQRELLEKEISKAENRFSGIGKPIALDMEENLKLRGEFDNVIRRVGNFEADLRTIRSLIDILNGLRMTDEKKETACCPLCGAEPAHWTRDLNNLEETSEYLRKELDICRSEHTALKKRLDAWERAEKRNEAIQAERKEVGEQLDRFREQLKASPDHDPQAAAKLERLTGRVQFVRETTIKLEHEEIRIASETELRDKYQTEGDILHKKIQEIEDEMDRVLEAAGSLTLGDLEPMREDIRKRETMIETIRQQEKRIAELEGKRGESHRQLERLNRQFEDQCRMRDNLAGARVWFGKCEQALRWLHKDGLPRLIHASVLKDLVQVINGELRQYNEPFKVAVNEDLTFRVHFPDGTQGISTSISGGQRYLLVLSFLMAMNRTFAQNLGIMFLDEPTAFLDEENVMFLTKILEQLKRILRSRGRQLVIVTHVETLATIADTVYSLARLRQTTTGTDRSDHPKRPLLST